MSKKATEIKIDEILTRSSKRVDEKKAAQKKVKESQMEMPGASAGGGIPGANGMPGNFSEIFNNPDVMKMFSGGSIPGFGKLPLKQRIMFKLMGFFGNPKAKGFLRKRWWPLWAIVLVLLLAVGLVLGLVFLVFKLIKIVLGPYIDLFKRKG